MLPIYIVLLMIHMAQLLALLFRVDEHQMLLGAGEDVEGIWNGMEWNETGKGWDIYKSCEKL